MFSRIKLPSFKRKKKELSFEHNNEKLVKHLKSFRQELGDYLDEIQSTMNLSSQLAIQLTKKPEERNEGYDAILGALPKDLNVDNLHFLGNNNFNMKVNTKNAAIMVQGIALYQNQIDALDKLISSGTAKFLPVNYGQPLYVKSGIHISQLNYDKNQRLNNDTPREAYRENFVISCIEQFPMSFNDKASQTTPDNVYDDTADIARQFSGMLATLTEAGIVWTDIKPGNLLTRHDGSLAVADLKGFADINTIFLSKTRNFGEVACNWNANCTTTFISAEGQKRLFDFMPEDRYSGDHGAEARAYFFNEWQKEYSYQMGVVLYVALTGRVKAEELMPNRKVELDFDLPVFKTPQGKEYKAVLEALTAYDPDQRVSYSQAATMLETIANQNKSMPEKFCHHSYKERLSSAKPPQSENPDKEQSLRIK